MRSVNLPLLFCLSVSLFACTKTLQYDDSEIVLQKGPEEDAAYAKALKAATRQAQVYGNFETKFMVQVTYLSPEFRQAFRTRYESLYKQGAPMLDEATRNAGFFVSIFSPEAKITDLDNENLWTILMSQQNTGYAPTLVKHLSRKEQWYPFFPYVNQWTREYLVLFEAPSITPHAPEMVKQTALKLSLFNADARINMSW